jgi:hypothetical protein
MPLPTALSHSVSPRMRRRQILSCLSETLDSHKLGSFQGNIDELNTLRGNPYDLLCWALTYGVVSSVSSVQ